MELEKHLIDLSNAPGMSGYEAPVREMIRAAWESLAEQFDIDGLGSLSALRHGVGDKPRRCVMVTAHMDEIGLMVTSIDGAFLRVTRVGGIDRRVLLGQPVIVHGKRLLSGIIGSRPPHILSVSEKKRYPGYDDLVVDTGLTERELKQIVPVGTVVTFDQQAVPMGNGLLGGKALDNRASIAALTLMLEHLQGRRHDWDIAAVATTQEEVGTRGGTVAAWHTRPDLAIVIDTTWGTGVGVSEDKGFPIGEGLTLVIGPNAHPKLFDLLRKKAAQLEIPITPEPAAGSSGTDGWAIQVSRQGVPTAIIGIPIRNMHTPVEVVALKDIERAARLISEFVCGLDDESLDRLALAAGP
ncbi:MAG: M20/M25/M40 family metallo-hydrolase [Anaerolineae bacterium]|nr:M20/M25/M40 family metallo-hydrolase [Anaerolineae bacterium]